MNDPILHIGYPKAASTWLSANLFNHVQNAEFVPRQHILEHFIKPSAFAFNKNTVKKFFEKYKKRIIISDSMLLGGLIFSGINLIYTKELAQRLKSVFPDASIILFIREQRDIISSAYIEYVKSGGTFHINRYLNREINPHLQFNPEYFHYDKIIELYYSLFGKGNVYVYLFEEFQEDPKKIIHRIIEQFNLQINIDEIDFIKENIKYREGLLYISKFLNHFTGNGIFLKSQWISFPQNIEKRKKIFGKINQYKIFGKMLPANKILGKDNYEELYEYYKESNHKLCKFIESEKLQKYHYAL